MARVRSSLSASGLRQAAAGTPGCRPMDRAAARANRRRAWPRWMRPLLQGGVLVLGGGAAAAMLYGVWQAGLPERVWAWGRQSLIAASAEASHVVADVLVEGREKTSEQALWQAIGVRIGDPIFAIDLEDIRERVEALPWVAAALVERRLPDTLLVRLTEHQAMAIWQVAGKHMVISHSGSILAEQGAGQFPELPLVVGEDAPTYAGDLLTLLAGEPVIRKRVESAVRIGKRRWDLRLDNGLVIKLPESDISGALHRLAVMQERQKILDRDIVAIDLRLADRMTIQTVARQPEGRKSTDGKT